jgi:hypothetical protein
MPAKLEIRQTIMYHKHWDYFRYTFAAGSQLGTGGFYSAVVPLRSSARRLSPQTKVRPCTRMSFSFPDAANS